MRDRVIRCWKWWEEVIGWGKFPEPEKGDFDVGKVKPLPDTQAADEFLIYVLGRPDAIRQRAQYAATVAGVVATAFAVAGGLTNLGRFPHEIVWVLGVAGALWIGSTFLWVLAIAGRLAPVERFVKAKGVSLEKAIECATQNAEIARRRLLLASWSTALAMVVTVGGFAAVAIKQERDDEPVKAVLVLTGTTASAAAELCNWDKPVGALHLRAEVRTADLTKAFVTVTLPKGGEGKDESFQGGELDLRTKGIAAVRRTNTPPDQDACPKAR